MTEKAIEEILPAVNSMARFFNLRRQKDRQFITDRLIAFDAEISTLRQNLIEQERRTKALEEELAQQRTQNVQLNGKIENLQQNLATQRDLETSLRAKLSTLSAEKDAALHEITAKDEMLNLRQAELAEQIDRNRELSDKHDSLVAELGHISREHTDLSERFTLISSILAAPPKILTTVDRFKSLFNGEFIKFANWESSLANEAEAILIMQDVMDKLELMAAFPPLFTKTVGAVGGGFSSGKSAFLNSFFREKEIELPVGINPVTSLPCYVIASQKCCIYGHARNGGVLPISTEIFNRFTPDFLNSFSFNMKEIMPTISIGASLDPSYFQDLCLIDTPGYNPSDQDGLRADDRNTAMAQLKKARFIIWMIGLDSHGTVPKTDIDFLTDQAIEGKQIYVVLNKADLKPPSQLDDIMDEVKDSMEDWDIPYAGISAYSAIDRKEHAYVGQSLVDFLSLQNQKEETVLILKEKIESVFSMYIQAIDTERQEQKKRYGELHSLKLDMLELGMDDTQNKAYNRITTMQNTHTTEELQRQLNKAKELQGEFSKILDEFENELQQD